MLRDEAREEERLRLDAEFSDPGEYLRSPRDGERDLEATMEVERLLILRGVSSSSSGVALSPSSPHPTPQPTSSTTDIDHRLATEVSMHPFNTRSAPRPIPVGISNTPKFKHRTSMPIDKEEPSFLRTVENLHL